ncbi:unnamed protein product [marine sediment metagenome]|uniref:Uncharacterized protein n=1 Tax=marine sediment metagenome TaxID=412755 RepID=X0Z8B8_9ZZZZ
MPFNKDIIDADVSFYKSKGVNFISSFAAFLDDKYVKKHNIPPIKDYGSILNSN